MAVGACTSSGSDTATSDADVVGGVRASGAKLDVVGSLVNLDADAGTGEGARFSPFCTATLVGPKLLITAKHCASLGQGVLRSDVKPFYFNVGADARAPSSSIKVVKTWLSPLDGGGMAGEGSDVALLELEREVPGVTPLEVADGALGASLVGARLSAVGFGVRDRQWSVGARMAGTVTLRATQDRGAQQVFASEQALIDFARSEAPQSFDEENDPERLSMFWYRKLLPEYEVFTGLAEGDAQPCTGDSGGPLLARVGDALVVVGVVSASHKLAKRQNNPCSMFGEVYASFGPAVQTLFDTARSAGHPLQRVTVDAVDAGSKASLPAPDLSDGGFDAGAVAPPGCRGLDVKGTCDDGAALRCVAPDEGVPRATRTDCTLLLSDCRVGEDGAATCVDR